MLGVATMPVNRIQVGLEERERVALGMGGRRISAGTELAIP
jgi:hypothetical protein